MLRIHVFTKTNVGGQVISSYRKKGKGIVQGSNIGPHDIASYEVQENVLFPHSGQTYIPKNF